MEIDNWAPLHCLLLIRWQWRGGWVGAGSAVAQLFVYSSLLSITFPFWKIVAVGAMMVMMIIIYIPLSSTPEHTSPPMTWTRDRVPIQICLTYCFQWRPEMAQVWNIGKLFAPSIYGLPSWLEILCQQFVPLSIRKGNNNYIKEAGPTFTRSINNDITVARWVGRY